MKTKHIFLISLIFYSYVFRAQEKKEVMEEKDYIIISEKLDSIHQIDQKIRFELISLKSKIDTASEEEKKSLQSEFSALVRTMKTNDSLNLREVEKIIEHYGWVGPDKIGEQASQALFLVIQHADINTQKKYLPIIRKAANEGQTSLSNLAILEDRIAIREGKKQIYGSQVWIDPVTNKYYVDLLSNPDNVDERRAKMGLPPMKIYLQQSFGMEWDAEDYKKNVLPELEKLKASRMK